MLLVLAGMAPTPAVPAEGNRPSLLVANVYHPGIKLQDYWVSEKYDGVRGYWDGEKLLARGGQRIYAPAWFTAGWPTTPLDGELWAGRGRFFQAVSTERQQTPVDSAWRDRRLCATPKPACAWHPGDLPLQGRKRQRCAALCELYAGSGRLKQHQKGPNHLKPATVRA